MPFFRKVYIAYIRPPRNAEVLLVEQSSFYIIYTHDILEGTSLQILYNQ